MKSMRLSCFSIKDAAVSYCLFSLVVLIEIVLAAITTRTVAERIAPAMSVSTRLKPLLSVIFRVIIAHPGQ